VKPNGNAESNNEGKDADNKPEGGFHAVRLARCSDSHQ